jgi:hypothetical protein
MGMRSLLARVVGEGDAKRWRLKRGLSLETRNGVGKIR